MSKITWLAHPSTMRISPSLAKQFVIGTTTWLASIYNGNITKSGQAIYNGYNYLTGLSIHNGNITKSGQAVYNRVIHQMY